MLYYDLFGVELGFLGHKNKKQRANTTLYVANLFHCKIIFQ